MKQWVVARRNEPIEPWLELAKSESVLMYDKGNVDARLHTESIPDVGREPYTYLYHIVKNYDNLAEMTFFSQGNPFDHCPDFFQRSLSMPEDSPFTELGRVNMADNREGAPAHPSPTHPFKLDILGLWNALELPTGCPDVFSCKGGCMLAVPRANILARSKKFWEVATEQAANKETAPWEYERLLPYLFRSV